MKVTVREQPHVSAYWQMKMFDQHFVLTTLSSVVLEVPVNPEKAVDPRPLSWYVNRWRYR
jgi:hypothetical protein